MTGRRPYTLVLTPSEAEAADMFAHAYASCAVLSKLGAGAHRLTEPEAWELGEAYREDTEDLRTVHPVFAEDLDRMLCAFVQSIV